MNAPLPNLDSDFDLLSMREALALMDALAVHVKRRAASCDSDELVVVKSAAAATGLSEDTICRRLKANPALGLKIGGRWFVHLKALIAAEAELRHFCPGHVCGIAELNRA
jgi:hypothetical protein